MNTDDLHLHQLLAAQQQMAAQQIAAQQAAQAAAAQQYTLQQHMQAIYTRPLSEEAMRTNLSILDRSVSVKKIECCGEKHRIDYLASQKILAIYNHPVLTDDDHYINKALSEMGEGAPLCFKLLNAFHKKLLSYDHATRMFVIETPTAYGSFYNSTAVGIGSIATATNNNIVIGHNATASGVNIAYGGQ